METKVSLDYLLEERNRLNDLIELKSKEEALFKSGILSTLKKGENYNIDVDGLTEVEKPSDILFLKWFVEYKTNYTGVMPRYIHKVKEDRDSHDWSNSYEDEDSETTYIFANERHSLTISSGRLDLAVIIHDDSIPYLMEEFREWAWDLKIKERKDEEVVVLNEQKPNFSSNKPSFSSGRVVRRMG